MSDELSTSVITDDRPAQVHPMAVVDPRAELAHGVVVGPGAVRGPEVRIGANTWIGPHVVLDGLLRIAPSSPCVDLHPVGAGLLSFRDLDGRPRPLGAAFACGAHEVAQH